MNAGFMLCFDDGGAFQPCWEDETTSCAPDRLKTRYVTSFAYIFISRHPPSETYGGDLPNGTSFPDLWRHTYGVIRGRDSLSSTKCTQSEALGTFEVLKTAEKLPFRFIINEGSDNVSQNV